MSTYWNGMTESGAPKKYPKPAKQDTSSVSEVWQLLGEQS